MVEASASRRSPKVWSGRFRPCPTRNTGFVLFLSRHDEAKRKNVHDFAILLRSQSVLHDSFSCGSQLATAVDLGASI